MKKIIIGVATITIIGALLTVGIILAKKNKSTVATSNNIVLSESTTINNSGTYNISGTLKNGMLTIDTTGDVTLVLDGVNITNKKGPAIYIKKANNVTITLKENTESTLIDGTSNKYDAVIYSAADLTINGNGTLNVNANTDGIATKDDLIIESGILNITANDDGIKGRDSVTINDGTITINSKGDGIKSTNDENIDKGDIIINGGTIKITSGKDGIQSIKNIMINAGDINITTGNGGTTKTTKEDFGRQNEQVEDKDSIKGIKAANNITIKDGTITIDSEDDSIHSNNSITIENGVFKLNAGDDGIHADALLEINGGTFTIDASEGLEATYVKVNKGTINIEANDDGINAANKSNAYTPTIEINGGDLTISMAQGDTDGIDSNGSLYINDGTINIECNSPFDYDGEGKYSGGSLTVNGSTTTELTNQMMGGGMQPGGI